MSKFKAKLHEFAMGLSIVYVVIVVHGWGRGSVKSRTFGHGVARVVRGCVGSLYGWSPKGSAASEACIGDGAPGTFNTSVCSPSFVPSANRFRIYGRVTPVAGGRGFGSLNGNNFFDEIFGIKAIPTWCLCLKSLCLPVFVKDEGHKADPVAAFWAFIACW